MTAETHFEIANFIWSICNLLRGLYRRNEYRKVILPLPFCVGSSSRGKPCFENSSVAVSLRLHTMV